MTHLWPNGEPVTAEIGPDGAPCAFLWGDAWHPVAAIAKRWRIRTSWWATEAWQEYVKLTTADGLLCILAHDLRSGEWRLVRLYD